MRTTFYKVVAYSTLFVDAYLALALVATAAMPRPYHHYLPPFGLEGVAAAPRILVLLVVTWTAFLAVGCLGANNRQLQGIELIVVFWVLLLLVIVWLALVLPCIVAGLGHGLEVLRQLS
jgi:hypothetical protein